MDGCWMSILIERHCLWDNKHSESSSAVYWRQIHSYVEFIKLQPKMLSLPKMWQNGLHCLLENPRAIYCINKTFIPRGSASTVQRGLLGSRKGVCVQRLAQTHPFSGLDNPHLLQPTLLCSAFPILPQFTYPQFTVIGRPLAFCCCTRPVWPPVSWQHMALHVWQAIHDGCKELPTSSKSALSLSLHS